MCRSAASVPQGTKASVASWTLSAAILAFTALGAEAQQLFEGPAFGSIDSGERFSTDLFGPVDLFCHATDASAAARARPATFFVEPELPPLVPARPEMLARAAPEGSNEVDDSSLPSTPFLAENLSRVLSSFPQNSPLQPNPADPVVAAGREHLVTATNEGITIFAKTGTFLKQVQHVGKLRADPGWFQNVLPGPFPYSFVGDPKVLFDHHDQRWLIMYLAVRDKNPPYQGFYLLSVSDDNDPLGNWCNYALPSDVNGSTPSGNWGDYNDLAVDDQSVYISGNQFGFPGGGGSYAKVRVIPKDKLYSASCGEVAWADFWDLRNPDYLNTQVFTVRPAVTFGQPGVQYFVSDGTDSPGTHITLWELTPDLHLTGQNVPVTASMTPTTRARQRGTHVEINHLAGGGRRLLNAVYRDGHLWTTQQVKAVTSDYTRIRYLKLNVSGAVPWVEEDVSFGAAGYWYFYPFLLVDVEGNMVLVFNRSSESEFINIRYTGAATSGGGLFASVLLRAGLGPHLKMCEEDDRSAGCTPVNVPEDPVRYGDYNGGAVDPSAESRLWLFSIYPLAKTPRPSYWRSDCGWWDDLQHYGWVAEVTFDPAFRGEARAFSLVGDKEGFHPDDPADSPPQVPRSRRVMRILSFMESGPGQGPAANLDEGGFDRPLGHTHYFSSPQTGRRILSATLEFRFKGTHEFVYNDVLRTSPSRFPVTALKDLLELEPQTGVAYTVAVDLARVPVRVGGDPGPGGHWLGGPDGYLNLLPRLSSGSLDVAFGDDVMLDYSELRIVYETH